MIRQGPDPATSAAAGWPETAANMTSAFGQKLLADVVASRRHENVFVSPLSVFFALAMTESGAAGSTRAAMRQALAVPAGVSEDDLHQSASALLKSLQSQKGVQLSIANALWSDSRLPMAPSFVERCRNLYQADATALDLASRSAPDVINNWVKEKTQDKIPKIVTPESLSGSLAVLTNAVYFKGGWEYKFDKGETKEGDFHLSSGQAPEAKTAGARILYGKEDKIKQVRFMHRDSIPHAYRSGPGFEAAALPYASSDIALYAILPAPGESPEAALKTVSVQKLRFSPEPVDLDLKLPTFTLGFGVALRASLERMGMTPAFQPGADFTPLGSSKFYISAVLHETRLEVDEEGTVAAAATAVTMGVTAMLPQKMPKKTLVFDRPFALLLCDTRTGSILFAGVIYDPK